MMFNNLTEKLTQTVKNLAGRGRLTETNIQETLRELRVILLEADVALPVVKQFITDISQKAIGQEVLQSLRPGETLIKIVRDELTTIMGGACEELNLQTQPPAVILMAGLQGSGKTTTVAKLAYLLKTQQKKKVLITSSDIYRPAASEQLAILAQQIGVEFLPSEPKRDPVAIATTALKEAKKKFFDVVIVDTAGRLHIDQEMITEISNIHKAIEPIETLLVVDSMTGQDAANIAKAFNVNLPLTGVILTKVDGDARGGAALSVRMLTGKPIKFIGTGEKIAALEPFYPERIVSRILGMGDVLTLIEEVEQKVDQKQAQKLTKKFVKGKKFDLEDFRQQLQQLKNMGGIGNLLSKLPGIGGMSKLANMADDKTLTKMETIINSMTRHERHFPDVIKASRKQRIAAGSGTQVQDINRLLKQFSQMQKMMKRFKGKKMMGAMRNLQNFM